ncbi:GNAT family N-acetyltransferase [Streptomyces sp. LX-29]|uniref:GNAT family N-acetyltransferase n=1 Tax=Streptomyces sp. LX-29 TaxID=2900152 RepID=UPI00240CEEBE|nr:GNAT family N-acetyltransferase [Streptomyces sp. LX-29]WFB08736.1 GNAT family N-acetyltransferase [Streptomyces sp. LX-29]
MGLDIRTIGDSDLADWTRALHIGFLQPPKVTKEELEFRRPGIDLDRTQGAFDSESDRCVATFRSFALELTAVGGAAVPTSGISNVTVSPTHRRRGLLGRMMERELRAARERGDAAASLIASEYPIYGRFGFGPAAWVTEWEIDVARSGLDPRHAGPVDGARIDLVDAATVRTLGPALHDRLRATRPGFIERSERWWLIQTGELGYPDSGWKEPFYAVYRSPEGSVDGLLAYVSDDRWEAKRPHDTATVVQLLAASPAAERALWHYVMSVDWVTRVRTGLRAPDDLLPLLLPDPRAATVVAHADFLWLRPLDVPRLLEARGYPCADTLVLELTDRAGLAGGRYLLEAGPDGASCVPTTRSADLALDIADLGTLWLGDESAVRLAALGRVAEERAGTAARADLLLRAPRRPWCPDVF